MILRQTVLVLILAIAMSPSAMAQHHGSQQNADRFQHMQQMMDQADETTEPAERRKLMHEHMDAMHKQMQSMHGMMDAPEGGTMQERMQKMHQRMDMMQMMMEQMMGQHRMMMDMPGEKPEKQDKSGDNE